MHFQFPAGHPVSCSGRKPLGLEKRRLVQLSVMNKGHHIDSSQVAHSMTVQKDLSAGIAAPEICSSLLSGFFVYPSGLPGIAHLLQMPVKLLSGRFFPVKNRIVAHLAVSDTFIDLPVSVHLTVKITLRLDTFLVVLVDKADLRGTAHAAGNHVLPNDIGDVQKVDGGKLDIFLPFAGACGNNYFMNFVQHCHHRFIAASCTAENMKPFSSGADAVVFYNNGIDLCVLPVGEELEIVIQGLRPSFFRVPYRHRHCVSGKVQIGIFQTILRLSRRIRFVKDPHICPGLRQLPGVLF